MKLRTIDKILNSDLRGKYVLLRDDFNVQIVNGEITDAFRIDQSMPTINALRNAGARIAICAHLGRPGGVCDAAYSLGPVAEYMKIPLIPDCLDRKFLRDMHDGDVVLLENVRFYPGEEKNDTQFAQRLATGFDIFVNDAFAVSHRAAASTVGVAEILPSYAGLLLGSEITNLDAVMTRPARPLVSIVGGSKVSTKIGVLRALAKMSDTLIIGGALGTTFNWACGQNVGNSLFEADMADTAREIMAFAAENNCKILIPLDKGVGTEFLPTATRIDKTFDEILPDDIIIDAGPQTTARDVAEINAARTVIWNGTVGMAEWIPTWSTGTFAIARAIAAGTAADKMISVVGGGDTVAAVHACGVANNISYLSTGGGAFLEYIEGRTLPAIAVLMDK